MHQVTYWDPATGRNLPLSPVCAICGSNIKLAMYCMPFDDKAPVSSHELENQVPAVILAQHLLLQPGNAQNFWVPPNVGRQWYLSVYIRGAQTLLRNINKIENPNG